MPSAPPAPQTVTKPPRFELELEATSFTRAQLLSPDAPQVALAGRSNVGKSSLINALAGRRSLAKTSATPGKTRSINYYRIVPHGGFAVDLPGYGYAKCSQDERKRWAVFMEYYFRNTPGLAALLLLIDSRLSPQQADKDLAVFAASLSLPVIPVLTKTDKCSKKEVQACIKAWSAHLDVDDMIVTSASKKTGVEELRLKILELTRPNEDSPAEPSSAE